MPLRDTMPTLPGLQHEGGEWKRAEHGQTRVQSAQGRGALPRCGIRASAAHETHLWMYPGMMPILHSPGLMMPGQLGPMRRVLF